MRVPKEKSLADLNPELAAQWYSSRNQPLTPEKVTPGSHKKVWWSCARGSDHEWKTTLSDRLNGRGCPYCSGKRASATNNLAYLNPELAAEWHPGNSVTMEALYLSTYTHWGSEYDANDKTIFSWG